MESAIDTHLVCPRTLSRRVPDDYEPPFPMWVGRADTSLQQVVLAYLGVQFADGAQGPAALAALRHIVSSFDGADGPVHHDLTHHVDNQDHHNLTVVGYWSDPAAYCHWLRSDEVKGWWESDDRLSDGLGYFRETTAPRVDQFETSTPSRTTFPVSVPSWGRSAATSTNTGTGARCASASRSPRPTGCEPTASSRSSPGIRPGAAGWWSAATTTLR